MNVNVTQTYFNTRRTKLQNYNRSLSSDLVDLGLQVADYLWGHLLAKDFEQVDGLRTGYGLGSEQFHAFLDVLDFSVLRYEVRALRLSDGFVRKYGSLFGSLWHWHCQTRGHHARAQNHDAHKRFHSSTEGIQ